MTKKEVAIHSGMSVAAALDRAKSLGCRIEEKGASWWLSHNDSSVHLYRTARTAGHTVANFLRHVQHMQGTVGSIAEVRVAVNDRPKGFGTSETQMSKAFKDAFEQAEQRAQQALAAPTPPAPVIDAEKLKGTAPTTTVREPSEPPVRDVEELVIGTGLPVAITAEHEVSFALDGNFRVGAAFESELTKGNAVVVGFDRKSVVDDVPTVYLLRSGSMNEPGAWLLQERTGNTLSYGFHVDGATVKRLRLDAHVRVSEGRLRFRRLCPAAIEVIGGRRYLVFDAHVGRDAQIRQVSNRKAKKEGV